jgi:indolepyruvate ferredoxin oxidoreductase
LCRQGQRGWVPVGESALERAIELNGVAVEFNKNAFLLGRRFANQPELVESPLPQEWSDTDAESTLDQVIEDCFQRLVAYQTMGYAQRYLDQIEKVRSVDGDPEASASLTHTVALQLFKLMAYKDEYEVARLHSVDPFRAKLDSQFTGNCSIRFHLAPPLLSKADPNTGKVKKYGFGPWLIPMFRILAKLKWLRGTRWAVFALTSECRRERGFGASSGRPG